jgi:hypothetical protein
MRVPVVDAERHLPPAHFWGALIKIADAADPDCKFTAIDSCEASAPFLSCATACADEIVVDVFNLGEGTDR